MADVNTPVDAYTVMAAKWALPEALLGGTASMRAFKTTYLPREEGESEKAYTSRLTRTFLYPAYSKALEYAAAKPFQQPITFSEDFNPNLEAMASDIDLQGNDLNVFAREAFSLGCHRGVHHILVDMPSVDTEIKTLADQRAANVRPYMVNLDAADVIGWQPKIVNGRVTIGQLRFRRFVTVPDGLWGSKIILQVFVHTPGQVQVWQQTDKGEWTMVRETTTGLTYIPVFTFYTTKTGFMTGQPLFNELAYKNLEHWQSASDQANILHKARVPILFFKGAPEQPDLNGRKKKAIEIGPNSLVQGGENSDLKYVEHTGKAIDSGRTALDDVKREMSQLAYEIMIGQSNGDVKATERIIEQAQNNTVLSNLALRFKDTLEQAFYCMADYAGEQYTGGLNIFTDFNIGLFDNSDMTTLIEMKKLNVISNTTLINEAKRRNILSEDVDATVEAELTQSGVDYSNSAFEVVDENTIDDTQGE